jgi:integrase
MDQRILLPRIRIEYESKWSQLIEPKLGKLAVRDLTTTAVRAWFAGLDSSKPTRNGHAYAILNMICNTVVKDGLLERNPCQIVGAMNPKPKKKVKIPTTVELHTIADKLGADERTSPFKSLVLLAGWCGMRFGEVTELRRKDFDRDCTVVTIARAVTPPFGRRRFALPYRHHEERRGTHRDYPAAYSRRRASTSKRTCFIQS